MGLKIVLYKKNNFLTGFEFNGHAGEEQEGENVICAYASAVAQGTVLGLTDVLNIKADHSQEKGLLKCHLPEDIMQEDLEKAQILIKTLLVSMKSLNLTYENEIVEIIIK